ncbi:class I SAM-dependent methyltransferase [Candidatus Daviesbacteria bacterium]|nr:class I SAM-dependent methyltransferase [Candidatus Daviesbacteria bacterium]
MKKLTKAEKITIDSYNLFAPEWAANHANQEFWRKELATFKRFLPAGKILEVGCGGGRDAQSLSEAGYEYTGTDISKGLLEVAQQNNPHLTFFSKSVYGLDFPKDHFDGFWASAVLLHIPKKRINEALVGIHRVIRNQGVGFISIKQGVGEKISDGDEKFGNKFRRLFALYKKGEFANYLLTANYSILETQVRADSSKTVWLVYFVQAIK